MRQKEYAHKELYERRSKLLQAIPNFWPLVFVNGPQDLQDLWEPADEQILNSITDFTVSRYQIKSDTEGEPRSLRFTFEFDTSKQDPKLFEDTTITKDFEFIAREDLEGGGGYISRPVNFNWTKAAKKQGLNKMLDLAEQLYQAEGALIEKGAVEQADRVGLWQYEKLRTALEEEDEKERNGEDEESGRSFLDWFGYRGVVLPSKEPMQKGKTEQTTNGDVKIHREGDEAASEDEDEEEEEDDDGLLDVEVSPLGGDIAQLLAEQLWPDCMDFFIQSQTEDIEDLDELEEMNEDVDEDVDDEAPELVEFTGFEDADGAPPAKKQRKA